MGPVIAGTVFLALFGFFQFAYPAHLMRREQLNLFMYDWDYIRDTYNGVGWFSRMAGDFVDQFLYFPVLGPVLIALIITLIGVVTYKICRHCLGKWGSLGIAAIVLGWSFMRETENQYITQYSLAVLGYLALVLAALQFKKNWAKVLAAVVLLTVGVLTIGSPYDKQFGKLWGSPTLSNEQLIAMDVAAARGDWDKVLKLSEKDLYTNEASYFYNIAIARKGRLGNDFFNHSQNYLNGLFLWVGSNVSRFTDSVAGEVWYQLGDMTLAEQSTIVALQQSPKHTGARYLVRLAQITLVNGEYAAAQKYLNMLSKTLNYKNWAKKMTPVAEGSVTPEWLVAARAKLPEDDMVYASNEAFRDVLKGLLKANPDNVMARQYLLMYDLLLTQLDDFMEDYSGNMIKGAHYEQAILIWLNLQNRMSEADAQMYGVSRETMQKLEMFYQYPDRYKNTYWHYYMDLTTR